MYERLKINNFNSDTFLKPSKNNNNILCESSKEIDENRINYSKDNFINSLQMIDKVKSISVERLTDLKSIKPQIETLLYTNKNSLFLIDEFMQEEKANLELLAGDIQKDKVFLANKQNNNK